MEVIIRRTVALLAEGVDRNCSWSFSVVLMIVSPSSRRAWIEITIREVLTPRLTVALLAEGVDRNLGGDGRVRQRNRSPSSRRAWIEIKLKNLHKKMAGVSPSSRRAWIEIRCIFGEDTETASPSSRRAWIEISVSVPVRYSSFVALLAEGVDRNIPPHPRCKLLHSRPPRGGRG